MMNKIHFFTIPVSIVWGCSTIVALLTGSCEPFDFALYALVIIGVVYVIKG